MKKVLFLVLALLLVQNVYAQTVSIGVSPSYVVLDLLKLNKVDFSFFNQYGVSDAIYLLEPDDCLKTLITSYPRTVIVPKNTTRANPVKATIYFKSDGRGDKLCYLTIFAHSTESMPNASVVINQSVKVMVMVTNNMQTTTTIRQPSQIMPPTTTTKQTTTTQIPFIQNISTTTTTILQTTTIPNTTNQEKENKINLIPIILLVIIILIGLFIYFKYPFLF